MIFHWTSSNPADAANRTNGAYLAAYGNFDIIFTGLEDFSRVSQLPTRASVVLSDADCSFDPML